jgi:hypothetical protein
MAVANVVAYYDMATIAAAIRFTRYFLVKCHFSKILVPWLQILDLGGNEWQWQML